MDATATAQLTTYRLVDVDEATLSEGASPGGYLLTVRGTTPNAGVPVELWPQIQIDDPGSPLPDSWGIEVVGRFSGVLLVVITPYTATLELDAESGPVRSGGITVIGANKSITLPIPPD